MTMATEPDATPAAWRSPAPPPPRPRSRPGGAAERTGLSKRGISDLERRARTRPQRETIHLLAEALGLSGPKRASFVAAARRGDGLGRRISLAAAASAFLVPRCRMPVDPLIGGERELAADGSSAPP